jgi:EmrB/QacA subfamily drug resistance transporter
MSKWRGNQWAILLTLSLGFFMTLLDLTIVNIAIPDMIAKLHASLDSILWVLNAYILVLAVLLITAGRLGDLRGPRALFAVGVVVFTLSSLACGLSQNPAELITARAVQGLGAALLMPQTMTIIVGVFPPERRGAALGIWGAVAGVATIAGPTLGGLLVTAFDWRYIFFVNLPIGVIVLFMTFTLIPDLRHGVPHKLDVFGVLLASSSLFCLTFALIEGESYNWNAWIWGLIAAAAVLFVIFYVYQRSQQGNEPLVPFSLFRDRNYTVMNVVSATVSVGMIGMFLPMTIYLQSVLGFSALKAGQVMAPASLVSMFLAPVAGRMSDKIGGKYILMTGLVLYAAGMIYLAAVMQVGSQWYVFLPPFLIAGLGVGCVFAPMSTEAMRNVEPRMAGAASGVLNTIRQIGSVISSSAVGALLENRLAASLAAQAAKRGEVLPKEYRASFIQGFVSAAKSGSLEAGGGQSGAVPNLPGNVPHDVVLQIRKIAAEVFSHGFVDAVHSTLILPIVVVLFGAVCCVFVRRYVRGKPQDTVQPVRADIP